MNDETAKRMADQAGAGGAAEAALAAERMLAGTPVYGRDDERLGEISRDGMRDERLMIHPALTESEIAIPASAIVRRDATGVYTSLSQADLAAVLPPIRPGTERGMLDALSGGAEAAHADKFPADLP
ncbi:MAG TPA: hypothetical protein VLJ14_08265 [Ktedonobacterales bacterium]|jgi:hypothetical protein|nr:hypothetical protein [Ktedonobacterales bacterium]